MESEDTRTIEEIVETETHIFGVIKPETKKIQAQYVFLTYAQTDFEDGEYKAWLGTRFKNTQKTAKKNHTSVAL